MRNYPLELKSSLELSLKLCCANQAVLPTAVASHCLDACLLISSKFPLSLIFLIDFITYSGFFNLNIFNHSPSKRANIKYPVNIQENITVNMDPLSKDMKGNTNKHPTYLINLTLGNSLANCKSSSGDIFQSSGTENCSGLAVHNLFFMTYNTISKRVPMIGYRTKQNDQKQLLLKNNPAEKAKLAVTMPFGTIANSPEAAIIFGLTSIFFNSIFFLSKTIFTQSLYVRVAQINFNLQH